MFMIGLAKQHIEPKEFPVKSKIYAFDSTTIDLCMGIFWWAKYKSTKGGIKVHTLFDTQTRIPEFIHITEGQLNDVLLMDVIEYEPKAYYIFDRAYIDFRRLNKIEKVEAYFATRAKRNISYTVLEYVNEISLETGILKYEIIKLKGRPQNKYHPEIIRKIMYYDKEIDKYFEFLTNNLLACVAPSRPFGVFCFTKISFVLRLNFEIKSEEVALVYKQRWEVELFFKWIKQHLKIKSFWGRSENAVRIQIYCAVASYCLVAIVREKLKIELSCYEILRILSPSLLDKTPITQLLNKSRRIEYNISTSQQLESQGL